MGSYNQTDFETTSEKLKQNTTGQDLMHAFMLTGFLFQKLYQTHN